MRFGVLPHPLPFGAEHQRHPGRPDRFGQRRFGVAGQADPPEAGLGHLVQRSGKIDHPHPGHTFQSAARRLGQGPRFGRGVPVLGDQGESVEGRSRAKDGADIVRIGDLVEDQKRPPLGGVLQDVGEQKIVQPLDLGDQPLVRRVLRHEPAEIGRIGKGERHVLGQMHLRRRLAGRPDPDDVAIGIGECGTDCVPAPEARAVLGLRGGTGFAAHICVNDGTGGGWQVRRPSDD